MPALVSYWEEAILHFPLNQYKFNQAFCRKAIYVAASRHMNPYPLGGCD